MARSKQHRTGRGRIAPKAGRGTETAVDVVVGDKRRHIGLVGIENHGRDERGRVVGTNGIKWVTA
jgi:hypothetical protein